MDELDPIKTEPFVPAVGAVVTVQGPVDPKHHGLTGIVRRTWYKGNTLESISITPNIRKPEVGVVRVEVDAATTLIIHANANIPAPDTLKAEWKPIAPSELDIAPGAKMEYVHDNNDVVVNSQGGKQSRVDYAFTELEPDMLLRVTQVLHKGKAKYGAKNWRQIPYEDHLNHIAYHWTMLHAQDTTEDHLANIICRAMFAMYMKGKP